MDRPSQVRPEARGGRDGGSDLGESEGQEMLAAMESLLRPGHEAGARRPTTEAGAFSTPPVTAVESTIVAQAEVLQLMMRQIMKKGDTSISELEKGLETMGAGGSSTGEAPAATCMSSRKGARLLHEKSVYALAEPDPIVKMVLGRMVAQIESVDKLEERGKKLRGKNTSGAEGKGAGRAKEK